MKTRISQNVPIKLLIYSHFFSPSIGGVETSIRLLADGLQGLRDDSGGRRFQVTVATPTPSADFDDNALSFPVIRRPSFIHLFRVIRASDVVHVAGPSLRAIAVCALTRKQFVIEHHGYQANCPNGLLLHFPDRSVCPGHFMAGNYRACFSCQSYELSNLNAVKSVLLMFPRRLLARSASHNIAITNHLRTRVALPHSYTIYYGINSITLRPAAPTGSFNNFSFAYLGRFVQEKGIDVLLEAAQQLVDDGFSFDLQLIGDGPERPRIQQLIQRMNLQNCVHLRGFLTGSSLAEALQQAHVVVVPSIWEEAAGLAAIEPMMLGKAVIASYIGGLSEVVSDSGLTFPVGDARALANCMRQLLQAPAQVQALGVRARRRAAGLFSLHTMIERHAEVYRECLTPSRETLRPAETSTMSNA